MVVIKYALAGLLLVAGLVAYSRREAIVEAYTWNPTIERPVIHSFDPKAVADAVREDAPQAGLRVAVAPDTRAASLPQLAPATTTPAPVVGGNARLDGVVLGPDGAPLSGATVRLERLVEDRTAALDVVTDANGAFNASALAGGRYRVRAWRAPTYTQQSSEVLFLTDGERRSLVLPTDAPKRLDLWVQATPSRVAVGQTAILEVKALVDVIDANGQIVKAGWPNELVTANGSGVLGGQGGQALSNGAGIVAFAFRCSQPGTGSFSVTAAVAAETVAVTCTTASATTGATTVGGR